MRVDASKLSILENVAVADEPRPLTESQQDRDARILYEYTYKDLLGGVDWDFIHMRQHFDDARNRGVQYIPYNEGDASTSNGSYLFFRSPLSPESKARGYTETAWYQTIQMLDLQEAMRLQDTSWRDKVMLAIAGDLKVHCTCPAFNYWGYRYIITQLGAAIYPQPLEPDVRNPSRRGVICKHLATVLQVLPFWWADIGRDLRKQGFEQQEPEEQPEPTGEEER